MAHIAEPKEIFQGHATSTIRLDGLESGQVKVYTKQGDLGKTSLIGQSEVDKDSIVFQVLGDLDELNSHLGVARAIKPTFMDDEFHQLQIMLLQIGAEVASIPGHPHAQIAPLDDVASSLERSIDDMTLVMMPLKNFIIPGGTLHAAQLHLARTVCRRAERNLVQLAKVKDLRPVLLIVLNRLSDWLFTVARFANSVENHPETEWKSK